MRNVWLVRTMLPVVALALALVGWSAAPASADDCAVAAIGLVAATDDAVAAVGAAVAACDD
jgi:hypothetical protein